MMRDEEFDNLGSQIKDLRIQMKLTQAEVAAALNVTPGYISNVENNRTAMSLRILMYYAKLMNISLDSLIGKVEPNIRKRLLTMNCRLSSPKWTTAERESFWRH